MAQTKYLLPISDRGTSKPWVRSDTGGSVDVYQAVNDTVDYRASVEVEPPADPARYCWGDSDEFAYGSNSLWQLGGDLPVDATNLHLWLKGWFINGLVGPTDQPCVWQIKRNDEAKSHEQAFTVSGNGDPTLAGSYVRYTLDLGTIEPWSGGVTWTPAVANLLKIGVRRAGTSTYRTNCATYYLAVTYDMPVVSVPRRATALLC